METGDPRRRRRWRAAALLAVVAPGTALGAAVLATSHHAPPVPPPAVSTAVVTRTDLVVTTTFAGSVGFGPASPVTSEASGTLTRLPRPGSVVRRGQPLYFVDDQPVVLLYGTTALYRTLRLPPASVPGATPPPAVRSARQALSSAQLQVQGDRLSLHQAEAVVTTSGRAALLQDRALLATARAHLAAARQQLTAAMALGCPATTDNSSSGVANAPEGAGTSGTAGAAGASGASGTAGATGTSGAPASSRGSGAATAGKPIVSAASGASSGPASANVLASVNPDGLDTRYFFTWGTSLAYGARTSTSDAGSGTSPVPVSASLQGLVPGTTYVVALVAANADGTTTGPVQTFTTPPSSCATERRTVRTDVAAVTQAELALQAEQVSSASPLATDRHQLAVDVAAEQADAQALEAAEAGVATPEEHGPDVALLTANLAALGYLHGGAATPQSTYTPAVAAAVRRWQAALGETPSGEVSPGQVAVAAGPLRVAGVTGHLGDPASAAGLSVTGTAKRVSFVGSGSLHTGETVKVAVGGAAAQAVITTTNAVQGKLAVEARLLRTGVLPPSGPVQVTAVTTDHPHALVVPVEALVALSGGGYALQRPNGRLLAVRVGLISNDLAEVHGRGVHRGLEVVRAV